MSLPSLRFLLHSQNLIMSTNNQLLDLGVSHALFLCAALSSRHGELATVKQRFFDAISHGRKTCFSESGVTRNPYSPFSLLHQFEVVSLQPGPAKKAIESCLEVFPDNKKISLEVLRQLRPLEFELQCDNSLRSNCPPR